MVRIVDVILSKPEVTEEELRALLVVEEVDTTTEETELIEPEETEISLTCEVCNSTEEYDVSVIRTFGSVRCKGCGFQIPAPKE